MREGARPCQQNDGNAMADKKPGPAPQRSSRGLLLPPNCREVTAEQTGTVIGIVGATAAKATKPG
jgi:hypothetical protein